MPEDSMKILVDSALRTRFEDLPEAVISATKLNLLDTLGCMIAGSSAPGVAEVRAMCQELGGQPQAAVLMTGERLPVTLAALVNGTMARARDMGNTHWGANVHPSEYVVPAALSATDCSAGTSGRDFLVAQAVGEDLLCRIGMALATPCALSGRYNLFRIFGPTIAVARLLGLDEETALMAMGLSYMQAGGEMQSYVDGALSIRVQQGLVCEAAVKSVLLARCGITGSRNILDGKFGFFAAFEPNPRREGLLSELGQRFEGANAAFKIFPCCHCTHSAIEATLALVSEHDLVPADVAGVRVFLNRFDFDLVGERLPHKVRPRTVPEAQFSVYYTVAQAIARRRVFLGELGESALDAADVLDIADRITAEFDPSLGDGSGGGHPARVRIEHVDGRTLEKSISAAKGDPTRPVTESELVEKFRMSCEFAVAEPREKADAIVEMVLGLEDLADMAQLRGALIARH